MAAIGGATGSAVSARRRASSPPPGPSPLIGLKPHEAGFVGRGQHEVASRRRLEDLAVEGEGAVHGERDAVAGTRSEEHTSELQSLMRISYAVFCLKKKKKKKKHSSSTKRTITI